MNRAARRLFVLAIAVVVIAPRPAVAFKVSYHREITTEALSFLKPGALKRINDGNEGEDENLLRKLPDERHFNNCVFHKASHHIRNTYEKVLESRAARRRAFAGAKRFGQLLHTIQDFYAHSNWVESGQTGLLSENRGPWPLLRVWQKIGGVILVGDYRSSDTAQVRDHRRVKEIGRGEFQAGGYRFSRSGDRAPVVEIATGRSFDGIVTGRVQIGKGRTQLTPTNCIERVTPHHWERPEEFFHPERDRGGLNKDVPARAGYRAAQRLALRQTRHEWCRLVSLVRRRGGDAQVEQLFDDWVADPIRARVTCEGGVVPLLPTPSSPKTPGRPGGWRPPTRQK